MAPEFSDTMGTPSPTQGPLKANPGGSRVNGKLGSTSKQQHITPATNASGATPGTKQDNTDPISEEPQPEDAMVPENAFETEHSKILFEAIDQLHSLGAGQLDIPQVRPLSQ